MISTVWVKRSKAGQLTFDTYPSPSAVQEKDAEERILVTNDVLAFDGLTDSVVSVLELYRLAFPLRSVETVEALFPDGAPSAVDLHAFWKQIEEQFLSLPLWALDAIAQVFHDLEETAFCRLFRCFAGRVRSEGRACGPWTDSFPVGDVYRNDKRRRPELTDCSPLDVDRTSSYFEPGGRFSRMMSGYESRKGQVAMSRAVATAFNNGQHLLVEAGTGVGKSLAYLIPAASWAMLNDVPVVVSTNTRNLQAQLLEHDLPMVRSVLRGEESGGTGGEAASPSVPLKAVLLKGRANYFCLHRLEALLENGSYELERPELRQFAETVAWICRSKDGDLDSFAGAGHADAAFLSKLSSTGEECPGRSCRFYRRCFLQKARAAASNAHVIIANHALVFAEARMPGSILPPYSQIIFDEAHNLEEAATRHLSIELSPLEVTRMLRRMSRGKAPKAGGMLETLRRHILKGAMAADKEQAAQFCEQIQSCKRALDEIRVRARAFFETFYRLLPADHTATRFRCVPVPGSKPIGVGADGQYVYPMERQVCRNGMFVSGEEGGWDESHAEETKENFRAAVAAAAARMNDLSQMLTATQNPDELPLYGDQSATVDGEVKTLREFECNLNFVFSASDSEHVFWIESAGRSRQDQACIQAAPLSIGGALADLLYKNKFSVVLCSATLRVGGSFSYISRRLGIGLIPPERVTTCLAESPFNYLTQCLALAPEFMPEPAGKTATGAYAEQLSAMMLDIFQLTRGRAMGLFTSYEMMNQVARLLAAPLAEAGIRLLVHGVDGTRDQLTRVFRSGEKPCVLFGVHSFWEGVDVAGEALSCVVLARLPFGAMGDPVLEARCEQIQMAGGSPFREFSLPQAVIRFRQGFGRLIRTKADRGIVIVADPRVLKPGYGSTFRKSLPCPLRSASSREDLLLRISSFFA